MQTEKSGHVLITNLSWEPISCPRHLQSLIAQSHKNKTFKQTVHNDRSSRSHTVFQIWIQLTTHAGLKKSSLLNIVDLAGSERRGSPGLLDSPLKKMPKNILADYTKQLDLESVAINKSLTTLGRIFRLLSDKKMMLKTAIPYWESKLTWILQNSLQADSKVLMIVNVCSEVQNLSMTKESLNFAKQAMLAY